MCVHIYAALKEVCRVWHGVLNVWMRFFIFHKICKYSYGDYLISIQRAKNQYAWRITYWIVIYARHMNNWMQCEVATWKMWHCANNSKPIEPNCAEIFLSNSWFLLLWYFFQVGCQPSLSPFVWLITLLVPSLSIIV